MARVQEVCKSEGIYLVNSVNPFRLEGQKTIMYRVLDRITSYNVCYTKLLRDFLHPRHRIVKVTLDKQGHRAVIKRL